MSPEVTYEKPIVEIGVSMQKQYVTGAKRHIVEERRTICTGGPATREFAGFLQAVTCDHCIAVWVRGEHKLMIERAD